MSAVHAPVLAGNWKMHHGPSATREFFQRFLPRYAPRDDRSVVFFPPALSLDAAREALRGRGDVAVGVQNIHWEAKGAFTGEISAAMAADAGAVFTLVGHSERRQLFGETLEDTARKTRAALAGGLVPVLCVGETLEEREAGRAEEVVERQLRAVYDDLVADAARRVLIAYEPVWAIGTGRTASARDASEMHGAIRRFLAGVVADAAAVPVLYGGSVKPENAAELLSAPDVGGVLVGGASLDPEGFARICEATG